MRHFTGSISVERDNLPVTHNHIVLWSVVIAVADHFAVKRSARVNRQAHPECNRQCSWQAEDTAHCHCGTRRRSNRRGTPGREHHAGQIERRQGRVQRYECNAKISVCPGMGSQQLRVQARDYKVASLIETEPGAASINSARAGSNSSQIPPPGLAASGMNPSILLRPTASDGPYISAEIDVLPLPALPPTKAAGLVGKEASEDLPVPIAKQVGREMEAWLPNNSRKLQQDGRHRIDRAIPGLDSADPCGAVERRLGAIAESREVSDYILPRLVHRPTLWIAAAAWKPYSAGPPMSSRKRENASARSSASERRRSRSRTARIGIFQQFELTSTPSSSPAFIRRCTCRGEKPRQPAASWRDRFSFWSIAESSTCSARTGRPTARARLSSARCRTSTNEAPAVDQPSTSGDSAHQESASWR